MTALRDIAAAWLARGRPVVVIEVIAARGSVPRETGTRMLVAADATAGTIGGGHLEWKAIEQARAMLGGGASMAPQQAHYPLGPALGQCCGGVVTLGFAALCVAALAAWEATPPMFHLQLYGAGHVGRAIVRALEPLDVHVDWIDEREDEFPLRFRDDDASHWPQHIRKVCVDAVEGEVRLAPPGAFYLVLTHQHDLDMRITEAILRRADFAFLGLIGSKTKKRRFVHRFEQRGIASDLIERLACPIGIEGIDGKEPEIIAVAVVAQLLQIAQSRVHSPARDAVIEAA